MLASSHPVLVGLWVARACSWGCWARFYGLAGAAWISTPFDQLLMAGNPPLRSFLSRKRAKPFAHLGLWQLVVVFPAGLATYGTAVHAGSPAIPHESPPAAGACRRLIPCDSIATQRGANAPPTANSALLPNEQDAAHHTMPHGLERPRSFVVIGFVDPVRPADHSIARTTHKPPDLGRRNDQPVGPQDRIFLIGPKPTL